ncbi:MAG TPA: damage-inducible protein [Stellaceae bacterium]|nr:damage-inducible protein [Stellaceae bacterium]
MSRPTSRRTSSLSALRDQIRHLEEPARHGVLPFGVTALDLSLPGGGLTLGAVHEILGAGGDEEDGAAAAGFAAGILARLGAGPVLWCLRRPDLYGPGLLAHGLDPARLVLVTASRDEEILWAVEEGLRTGLASGLAAVVGELGRLPMVAGRRLQLAAERSGVTALLLRRWRNAAEAAAERDRPSAALTRWRVAALRQTDIANEPGIGRPCWRVELRRCRGGAPGIWDMEVADATGHVSLSAELADRSAAPAGLNTEPQYRRAG